MLPTSINPTFGFGLHVHLHQSMDMLVYLQQQDAIYVIREQTRDGERQFTNISLHQLLFTYLQICFIVQYFYNLTNKSVIISSPSGTATDDQQP